jgi:hypothetical protein
VKSQVYLVQDCGGVSLEVVAGPFDSEAAAEIEEAIIQRVKADSGLRDGGDDTLHTLEIAPERKPEFGGFCGGYMENIRWVAAGCPPQGKPDTWDQPDFALTTKEKCKGKALPSDFTTAKTAPKPVLP